MTAAEATFRRLDAHDLPDLLELERSCFSCPWDERQYALAFEQRICHVFGLFVPGDQIIPGVGGLREHLVAYATVYILPPEMEILNIAVADSVRRQGYGTRLLRLVLQIAAKMGIQRTFLEVRKNNVAAHALYRSAGFETVGVRSGYYPDTGEDALLMRLDMDAGYAEIDPAKRDMDQGDDIE
ncbi:ribosomal-protein-alanine N-acetyltransferase [Oceanidesulfovibrio indonesiensis]|uniref:Ribosomal-protein-alanine N-acetyltransferase n=1 Tax=Oceanidesulfovibrio indonesiensis TaxID=54767 RepID=A0A7M3MCJ3_9BACT|nr:ribosomal protein S18-alanine N-acetyltransferase [Oceanidesulfovibrio indonesiensis]TVM15664.1 ribosomal-protein-alanine N-acetyltransferase [Oceanidesulfovibrio indonesiensis]